LVVETIGREIQNQLVPPSSKPGLGHMTKTGYVPVAECLCKARKGKVKRKTIRAQDKRPTARVSHIRIGGTSEGVGCQNVRKVSEKWGKTNVCYPRHDGK